MSTDADGRAMPVDAPTELCVPRDKSDLFWSFTVLALQGFGGVLAVVQRELVENKRWLTKDQFVEEWSVAQILPGPNVINLSIMLGGRYFGIAGALAGLAGMVCAPLMLVLLLAGLFASVADAPIAQGMLRGMGAVSAGLIIATGIKLMSALRSNPMGRLSCVLILGITFACIGLLHLRLATVLLSLGPLTTLWAWHYLRQRERT